MLYTFTGYESVHEAYVAILRLCIQLAVLCSLLISLDRIAKTLSFCRLCWVSWLSGRRPEDAYRPRELPKITSGSLYPRLAVQLPMFNELAVSRAAM